MAPEKTIRTRADDWCRRAGQASSAGQSRVSGRRETVLAEMKLAA